MSMSFIVGISVILVGLGTLVMVARYYLSDDGWFKDTDQRKL